MSTDQIEANPAQLAPLQMAMEYDPQPSFDIGSPQAAAA